MKTHRVVLLTAFMLALSTCFAIAAEPTTLKAPGPVRAVAFSPDGKLLAFGGAVPVPKGYSRGEVLLWDVRKAEEPGVLGGHPGAVACLAFSPDGKLLVSGGCRQQQPIEADEAQNIKVWDVASRRELTTLVGQGDVVTDVAFSPDGKMLASAGMDGTVKLRWADRQWQVRATLKPPTRQTREHPAFSLAFDRRGRWLAVGLVGGTIEIWDMTTLKRKHEIRVHEVKDYGVKIAISPDGATLAADRTDGSVQLWDTGSFQIRKTLKMPAKPWPIAFSPDGSLLAVGTAQRWDKPGHVILWDLPAGKQAASLAGHKKSVCCLAFSNDGTVLASGSYDGTVRLWPLADVAPPKAGAK